MFLSFIFLFFSPPSFPNRIPLYSQWGTIGVSIDLLTPPFRLKTILLAGDAILSQYFSWTVAWSSGPASYKPRASKIVSSVFFSIITFSDFFCVTFLACRAVLFRRVEPSAEHCNFFPVSCYKCKNIMQLSVFFYRVSNYFFFKGPTQIECCPGLFTPDYAIVI